MAKLIVDFDVLQSTINTYSTEINNFKEARRAIKRSLNMLETSGWDSCASKTWFSILDDEWIDTLDYQVRVLEHLKECLTEAKSDYGRVKDEQDKLDNCL